MWTKEQPYIKRQSFRQYHVVVLQTTSIVRVSFQPPAVWQTPLSASHDDGRIVHPSKLGNAGQPTLVNLDLYSKSSKVLAYGLSRSSQSTNQAGCGAYPKPTKHLHISHNASTTAVVESCIGSNYCQIHTHNLLLLIISRRSPRTSFMEFKRIVAQQCHQEEHYNLKRCHQHGVWGISRSFLPPALRRKARVLGLRMSGR